MNEINWREVAEKNGLSQDEFKKEIFTVACALATMELDEQDAGAKVALRFTCSDEVGKIEMLVRRETNLQAD